MLNFIGWRLYQNFLMPSRLPEYREMILAIKEQGYEFMTLHEYALRIRSKEPLNTRVCLLRNDVDSDPCTAAAMSEEDNRLNVRATYYFRLSTLDPQIMRSIAARGSEVGYHYEELATVAKRLRLRSRKAVAAHMSTIRDEFRVNICRFAEAAGRMPRTVASHGDFVNRLLNMPNTELLDEDLRREFGIVAEAYDPDLEGKFEARLTDRELPVRWSPEDPFAAMKREATVMRILVHPRAWRSNSVENVRQDVLRIVEGLRLKMTSLRAD